MDEVSLQSHIPERPESLFKTQTRKQKTTAAEPDQIGLDGACVSGGGEWQTPASPLMDIGGLKEQHMGVVV